MVMNARIWPTASPVRSITSPPIRMYAWFIRSPVICSNSDRIISRSRNPKIIMPLAPSSRLPVASHTRWEEIRFSSFSSNRIVCARGGASIPSSRSTARQ